MASPSAKWTQLISTVFGNRLIPTENPLLDPNTDNVPLKSSRPSSPSASSSPVQLNKKPRLGDDEDSATSTSSSALRRDTAEELHKRYCPLVRSSLENQLEDARREAVLQTPPPPTGLLGPANIKFDVSSHVGSFIISSDRLTLNSQSNFGSIRASSCVYEGKWQYEIHLGTDGVMQLGWATVNTKFTTEKGVGDSHDSFAYDGNRLRKWNRTTSPYGDQHRQWQAGDVIGTVIDLDKRSISFYRNGTDLGVAFESIPRGPSIAYFPAISLAYHQNITANFGATPLLYPVPSFNPLQSTDMSQTKKATLLLSYLAKLSRIYNPYPTAVDDVEPLLTSNIVMDLLAPLLKSAFVIQQSFIPFLQENTSSTGTIVEILSSFLEPNEMSNLIEQTTSTLITQYKSNSLTLAYVSQHASLDVLLALASHPTTRRILITETLLDKTCRLTHFLNINPPPQSPSSATDESLSPQQILESVSRLEKKHLKLLLLLLNNTDGTPSKPSSRAQFLTKLREHIQNVLRPGSILHKPLQKSLTFVFTMLKAIELLAAEELVDCSLLIPPSLFYDTSMDYFDLDRIGGLASHLYKKYHTQVSQKLAIPDYAIAAAGHTPATTLGVTFTAVPAAAPAIAQFAAVITGTPSGHSMLVPMDFRALGLNIRIPLSHGSGESQPKNPAVTLLGKESGKIDPLYSLRELLDSVIIVYSSSTPLAIEKTWTHLQTTKTYATALAQTQEKLASSGLSPAEVTELQRSADIFKAKLSEQSYTTNWIDFAVLTKERREILHRLLQLVTETLTSAAESELLAFVPAFYIDTLNQLVTNITTHFNNDASAELPDLAVTLTSACKFIATNFANDNLTPEIRETLALALSQLTGEKLLLNCLENIDEVSKTVFLRSLLRPYENRAWAQSNIILNRFWEHSPHAFASPPVKDDDASPSEVYQEELKSILLTDLPLATAFLHSVLNQLNWALSELISLVQEIDTAAGLTQRVFIESRQLKICSTCFELTNQLLRTLEMVTYLAPSTITTTDTLLSRLAMLLAQLFNRVATSTGSFPSVVQLSIPGLENIRPQPLLAPTAGILISLLNSEVNRDDPIDESSAVPPITLTFLQEPSFVPATLNLLLQPDSLYSLRPGTVENAGDNPDLSAIELMSLTLTAAHVGFWASKMEEESSPMDEDTVCTICYAAQQNATLLPCKHRTCKTCILHHLLNRGDCFFCKAHIAQVQLDNGSTIYQDAILPPAVGGIPPPPPLPARAASPVVIMTSSLATSSPSSSLNQSSSSSSSPPPPPNPPPSSP